MPENGGVFKCIITMITVEDAKRRLPIRELMRRLAVPAESIPERDGRLVHCPWPQNHKHGDRRGSFNTHAGGAAYKCFACGEQGDGPRFVALWLGLSPAEGFRTFMEMANQGTACERIVNDIPRTLKLPTLHWGLREDVEHVCSSRLVSPAAFTLGRSMGVFGFAKVCGFPCWLVTDSARKIAEARRIDGAKFPPTVKLGERKAHTLGGSIKSWPAGMAVLRSLPSFRAIMLLEGQPDLLAAMHFLESHQVHDVLPIAMLGRQAGATSIHPEALALLRDRRVRIYPHNDPDGGGMSCAHRWAEQLHQHGCNLDFFSFGGLSRLDGKPVKDLNDCTAI